ncbi:MAG: 3-deoxy-manno-octulosonate cytidylyltransferase [Rhodospirillaceae bacterium]|jgi:3-deoxy-manno-octulosonate cytidylyltransferase (CMP-KDO synthetase)|nr:3-deoxy-manno-octulosonate cytidylyltransferase [Rhodospirillaceae bacterium]MBT4587955.1 3-deoxy-manno-octulosonate cytidylyltransferase [Rhodospirillaceae bacterium]MBT4938651.1 3-deoxy-manno-octulosonate cytidylyltransferase [Rhodospirillaceae bacterium]MBT5941237.1 3-deoxy-manno-octulosonate cytidylyltransferase [Rhodospirillaceae bacterium]MBT7265870.1 3-deoxy-manno-octulosonate cytidylyltransferase [Rhodospirillaceae bacterium]
MKVLAVIPARWASTRFPGKPLKEIAGKAMIHWVWDQTIKANSVTDVVIATDDERIVDYCEANDLDVVMTSDSHPTGSDRLAEVAVKIEADVYVNVQGDEPLIEPETIDAVTKCLLDAMDHGVELSTGYIEKATDAQLDDPSVVHLVPGMDGCVITFSRLPVPYPMAETMQRTVHVGLYAFTRKALQLFAELERGPVERAESIEVMRYLEHGYRVACVPVAPGSIGVDTPEDLAKVEAILEAKQ